MVVRSGFFQSNGGDRRYQASFFASYFASFIGNGVFPNPSTNLQVLSDTNMNVNVNAGKGWINGYYLVNDALLPLTVSTADGVLNRIDRVVFAVDFDTREMSIYLKRGNPGSNPTPPALTRNVNLYELALADISVPAGTTSISQNLITDVRLNASLCGIVSGTVNQVDTTTLFVQYQQQFQDFLNDLEAALDGDVAGNLYNLISNLDQRFTAHESVTASTTRFGHIQLSNDTDSRSEQLSPTMRALNDVKLLAVNGKNVIASAINGKGGSATGSDTFEQLANSISAIATGTAIRSKQTISSFFPGNSNTSVDLSIQSVDITKSIAIFRPYSVNAEISNFYGYVDFISPNSIRVSRTDNQVPNFNANFEVDIIEFEGAKSVQSAISTFNFTEGGRVTNNIPINAVNPLKSVIFVNVSFSRGYNTNILAGFTSAKFTSGTNIQIDHIATNGQRKVVQVFVVELN